jgi:hypothetical protein
MRIFAALLAGGMLTISGGEHLRRDVIEVTEETPEARVEILETNGTILATAGTNCVWSYPVGVDTNRALARMAEAFYTLTNRYRKTE